MMASNICKKCISYVACCRRGRIYGMGDHRACPDCRERRRTAFSGFPAAYMLEEIHVLRSPL